MKCGWPGWGSNASLHITLDQTVLNLGIAQVHWLGQLPTLIIRDVEVFMHLIYGLIKGFQPDSSERMRNSEISLVTSDSVIFV